MRLALAALAVAIGVPAQDFSRDFPPLIARVETPPIAVPSGGGFLLLHELLLTNAHSKGLTITRVDVLGLGEPQTLEGEKLAAEFIERMPHKAVLPSGQSTTMLLRLAPKQAPRAISHRIHVRWTIFRIDSRSIFRRCL